MMVRLFLVLAGSGLTLAASAQETLILSDARIAPSAQEIAFSAARGKEFFVFEQRLAAGSKAVRISSEAPGFDCFAPAYSPDGRYLLYLKQPTAVTKKTNFADVILYDRQLHTNQQITSSKQNIRQALFSADGKRIVYTAAGFFGSYSPVGPKAPHELDLHSMTLAGADHVQHSRIKAYALGNLARLQAPGTYLMNIYDPRQKLSGTYAYTLSDSINFKLVKDKVAAEHQLDHLPNLTASSQKTVVYSIGNELFSKSMINGSSEKIYSGQAHSNPHPMDFVGSQNAIIFSETLRENPQAAIGVLRINLLNLEDSQVTQVPIRVE